MKFVLLVFAVIISQVAQAELPTISFQYSSKIYKERDTAIVTAVLSASSTVEISVVVVPEYLNSQADEMDHTMGNLGKIVIAPGAMSGSFSFYFPDDGINEGSETLALKMTAPQNARLSGSTMTIIIRDQSEIDLPFVSFSAPNYSVIEGGAVELKASLTSPVSSIVIVPISVSGTATHYVDHNMHYVDEFIFYPGMREATLTVSIFEDASVEPQENILIKMFNPIVNARMGGMSETIIFINDSDI